MIMMKTNKRVFLWGSYDQGNFGDDLMAVVLANQLKLIGIKPLVYGLAESLGKLNGIEVTNDIEVGIRTTDLSIIGGGEFLFRDVPLRSLIRSHPRKFERQCRDLMNLSLRFAKRIYAVSVGGDGTVDPGMISKVRQDLFSSSAFCGGTVRLKSDVCLLKSMGVETSYFPDILLCTPNFIQSHLVHRKKFRVGVNIHKKYYKFFRKELIKLAESLEDIEIVFLVSHLKSSGHNYEINRDGKIKKSVTIEYKNIQQFCISLSELDLVISSKLHVGVVTLAYGGKFISYGGKDKAKLFIHDLASNYNIENLAWVMQLQDCMFLSQIIETEYFEWKQMANYRSNCIESIKRIQNASEGHFEAIAKFMQY